MPTRRFVGRALSVLVVLSVSALTASVVTTPAPVLARPAVTETRPLWRSSGGGPAWAVSVDHAGAIVVDQEGYLRALDRSGAVAWNAELPGVTSGVPAVGRGMVVAGSQGAVDAFARRDGSRRWSQPMTGDVTSVAVAKSQVVAADHGGTLRAFDARDGVPQWSVHYDGWVWSAPRVDVQANTVVALWSQSTTPAIRAFDLATGTLRWEAPTTSLAAAPTIRRGLVVLAAGDGHHHAQVEARDVGTGVVRWATPVPNSFDEAIEPAADGTGVAVVDRFGLTTMLDLDDGRVLWQRAVDRRILDTRISITARRVVLPTFSGDVFIFDRRTGRVVAMWTPQQLGGYPIATVVPDWSGTPGVLTALRLVSPPHVDLRRLP